MVTFDLGELGEELLSQAGAVCLGSETINQISDSSLPVSSLKGLGSE